MYLIQNITDAPFQTQNLTLPDSTIVSVTLYFMPMQQGWFFTNITYGSFVLNGTRITNNPNLLLQFQNQIPFGIACFSTANREPMLAEDFSSGASQLYLLAQADVKEYYTFLQSGVF